VFCIVGHFLKNMHIYLSCMELYGPECSPKLVVLHLAESLFENVIDKSVQCITSIARH
jgi:hypothetical protein